MLSVSVKTTSDLMSIALQAEREAIRQYSELAIKMRKADNESTAALFERIVIEEQEHERLLLDWMAQENIDENPDIKPVIWHDPNVSTTYNDEARDPFQSSPYRALAFAVHNEEIAFRFYTQVTAESVNQTVRKYAEVLAREELGHATLLRAERRRAYHAEYESIKVEPVFDPKLIHSETDLITIAVHIDKYLLNSMNVIAKNTSQAGSPLTVLIGDTHQQISGNEKTLGVKPAASEDTIKMIEQLQSYNTYLSNNTNGQNSEVERLWSCCDRSFAFYDAVVGATTDEITMLTAQKLTASTLDRISALKQIFEKLPTADDSMP